MRTLITAFIWTVVNLAGLWIAWLGLSQVGRLGIAAMGLLTVTTAWVWLAYVIIALVKDRIPEPNLKAQTHTGGLMPLETS